VQYGTAIRIGADEAIDKEDAVKWYRLSAEQGNPIGQMLLGAMYRDGEGVPQNIKTAIMWIRKAADQGYPSAMAEIGWCYRQGNRMIFRLVSCMV